MTEVLSPTASGDGGVFPTGDVESLSLVLRSGILDPIWYAESNPDVAVSGVEALTHFMQQGWLEGRDPGPHFSTGWYRDRYMDGKQFENPLVHYLERGWRQGNAPSPRFNTDEFLRRHPAAAALDVPPLVCALAIDRRQRQGTMTDAAPSFGDLEARTWTPASVAPASRAARVAAFYLPQFHRIPENDLWWGEGFTEWSNVRRGRSRFPGHAQPHVPLELGHYDLSEPWVMERQVELARLHGVTCFVFYRYWFAGKSLLDMPLDQFRDNSSLDLEYAVCWANESWTRSWNGDSGDVLIEQEYSAELDVDFIREQASFLRDPRYMRLAGKPVLLVYRPNDLPDAVATAGRWRDWCRANGIGEIHLLAVNSLEDVDPRAIGFDSAAEFWPNNGQAPELTESVAGSAYEGHVYDWSAFVERSRRPVEPPSDLFRGVCLSWDNEARRPGEGTHLHGATPESFREWLGNVVDETICRFPDPEERLVFVNAWNEWAEGCHLEPDRLWGYQWLHALRDVQSRSGPVSVEASVAVDDSPKVRGVVVVAHDLHRHGAQLGSLALARTITSMGVPVEVVALGPGALEGAFRDAAPLRILEPTDCRSEVGVQLADDLRRRGFEVALINSLASGWLGPTFAQSGIRVITMVHELPQVITDHGLAPLAQSAGNWSNHIVFASESVRDAFPGGTTVFADKVRILPQGMYRRDLLKSSSWHVATKDAVDLTRPMVIGVGFGDWRKGFDTFVGVAELSAHQQRGLVFRWLGDVDAFDGRLASSVATAKSLGNFEILGFRDDVVEWLHAAGVLLLTSREDPFPSVVLEAAAVGLGAIVVRGCTGIEGAVAELAGRVCDSDEPAELLDEVVELLAADENRRALSRQRVDTVRWRFSHRSYATSLLALEGLQASVSVAVPSYRHAAYLKERLDSLIDQTSPITELLVSDDASRDGSVEIARQVLNDYEGAWLVRENDENSGSVFRQWIQSSRQLSGDFIWIAESDDVADPEFLSVMTKTMVDTGSVMAFCSARPISSDGTPMATDYRFYLEEHIPGIDWSRDHTWEGDEFIETVASVLNPVLTVSSVLFRRDSLMAALDRFEPLASEFPTCGDWVVYHELAQIGPVSFVAETLASHRRHEASVISSADRTSHFDEIERVQSRVRARSGTPQVLTSRQKTYVASLRAAR